MSGLVMAFMKKKRFKFQVNFEVEELSSVPFVNGILFIKMRLLDGGSFMEYSTREEVNDHQVRWGCKSQFSCKMTASATTGVLEPCVCRVSVRKELKGGKSYQKLGFADINLAEFAGAGYTSRRYLLDGYDSKRRQDNSTIKVNIDMALLSGDPCFKVPRSQSYSLPGDHVEELCLENKGGSMEDNSGDSVASGSSGFGSLPRKAEAVPTESRPEASGGMKKTDGSSSHLTSVSNAGHSRNSSNTSEQSKVSGYSSTAQNATSHSRQSSYDNNTHHRTQSTDSGDHTKFGSLGHRKKLEASTSIDRRVDSTRVDADDVINDIVNNFQLDDSAEVSGLQLYVDKDGRAVLGSQQTRDTPGAGSYERVVIDNR